MEINQIQKGSTIYVVLISKHIRIDKYNDVYITGRIGDAIMFVYTDKNKEKKAMAADESNIYTDWNDVLQVLTSCIRNVQK